MKFDHLMHPLLQPPADKHVVVWLRSGVPFRGSAFGFDANGLLTLTLPNGQPIIIDIAEIAAVQFVHPTDVVVPREEPVL